MVALTTEGSSWSSIYTPFARETPAFGVACDCMMVRVLGRGFLSSRAFSGWVQLGLASLVAVTPFRLRECQVRECVSMGHQHKTYNVIYDYQIPRLILG